MNQREQKRPLESALEPRFNRLLTEYRDACPDPEPSLGFLSQIWQRIDAKRNLERVARGWTSAYVTAAAVICLILVVLISLQAGDALSQTYVDLLDDNQDSSVVVESQQQEESKQ
jgi:anti-sigma-K factor RskA